MSRSGRDPGTRLKNPKGRTAAQARWLTRQLNDPYVKKAKAEGYRSRAAYKLIELDDKFGLVKGARRVVDLGVAPGGWTQVVRQRSPQAGVVGIDLLPTDPIEGAVLFQMDFMADEAPDALLEALGGAPDLVISDMAANTVGHSRFRSAIGPDGRVARLASGPVTGDAKLAQAMMEALRKVLPPRHRSPPAGGFEHNRIFASRTARQFTGARRQAILPDLALRWPPAGRRKAVEGNCCWR
jgi:hypothetical protein